MTGQVLLQCPQGFRVGLKRARTAISWLANCSIPSKVLPETLSVNEDKMTRFRSVLLSAASRLGAGRLNSLGRLRFSREMRSRRTMHLLGLIDAALGRLERGDFGICAECGEAIPVKRLEAIPWAAYCGPCQEQVDDRASDLNQGQLQLAI
jgi:hypothetical protein